MTGVKAEKKYLLAITIAKNLREKRLLTEELSIVAGLITARNTKRSPRYEKAKSRLDAVEAEIHDKNSRRKSIEHYLSLLEERQDAVTEYDARLMARHGEIRDGPQQG